ncbi:MAG: SpoIIE family protein phosphatase [Acidimicrobiales bacterium]|nr:SpoIIE family protein phosphatase [Acidimicrobiales bacterium]
MDRSAGEWNLAARQQAAVAHLSQFGLQSREVDEILTEAMLTAADTLGLTEVALFELVAEGDLLRGRAGIHDGHVARRAIVSRAEAPLGDRSFPGYALEQGQAVASDDLVAEARFEVRARAAGYDVRAGVAAPIGWDDESFGVLAVYDVEARTWTDDEVHFVQAIANTMGLAVQRATIEQSLRASTVRLDLAVDAGGLGVWSFEVDADRVWMSAGALGMYGLPPGEGRELHYGDGGEAFLGLIHPDDRDQVREGMATAVRERDDRRQLHRIVRQDNGEVRWIESWGRLVGNRGERVVVGVCADVTDRRRAEELRESILASEHAARLEAEAARERMAFLSEASAALAASLEPEVTVATFADLCVPGLADVCFVDLVDDAGLLAEQAVRATDDAKRRDGQALRRKRMELGGEAPTATGHNQAMDGKPVLYPEITDELLRMAASDDDHFELLRRFDARSTVLAPLVTRGRPIGVVTLVRCSGRPAFTEADLPTLEEFAGRAALAVDNGRLFHSRARVARSLQAALLPPALPAIGGLELAARYDVAETDVAIGGDFYDVIALASDTWAVVVGDVCGRGPDAAALTGLVRHTMRTAVVREELPSRVLAQTNEALLDQIDDARFCTAAFVRLQLTGGRPGTVRATVSSAGHPRPAVVRGDGTAEAVECSGTLLGVVDDLELVDRDVLLGPGDALVLYTDGLTEARQGDEYFGEARLLATCAELAGATADELAGGLEARVASFRRSARDDTAILVVRVPTGP